jgi:hypothetical protein
VTNFSVGTLSGGVIDTEDISTNNTYTGFQCAIILGGRERESLLTKEFYMLFSLARKKIKMTTIWNAGKDMENGVPHMLMVGIQSGTDSVGFSLAVLHNTKPTTARGSNNCALGNSSQRNEDCVSQKSPLGIHGNLTMITPNRKKLRHPSKGELLKNTNHNKKKIDASDNLDETPVKYTKCKSPILNN